MGGCSVVGCKNRTERKHQITQGQLHFYRFPSPKSPKEVERRNKWIKNLEYPLHWKPSIHSLVCETHFESKMFLTRVITKKKRLKINAVPVVKFHPDHNYTLSNIPNKSSVVMDSTTNHSNLDKETKALQSSFYHYESMGEVLLESICHGCHVHLKEIRCQESKIHSLEKTIETLKTKLASYENDSLGKFRYANNDFLKNCKVKNTKGRHFSNESIKNALKLRIACGKSGYDIVREYLPLPCERTLQKKRTEFSSFNDGILSEVLDMLKIKIGGTMSKIDTKASLTLDECIKIIL
eukprot:TRINITY_DN5285_c0_g1_i2.p1 TRINITY_DN5285_c0_g1~~TRINITY_DN5285_c0_g1_i2.p1  ORF type:complete len:295 (+),score=-32.37 TRINITY_DN5285_c0_g1_i2:189-1073(+)